MRKRRRRWPWVVLTILLILAALCFWAFYRGLTVAHYELHSPKLAEENLRIVVVSDLHGCVYGERQADLLRLVAQQKPDLIFLAGDIADDVNPLEGTTWFVEGALQLAPCYYVTGSHDLWRPDIAQVKEDFRALGVHVLEGDVLPITWHGTTVNICGLDDATLHPSRIGYLQALQTFSPLPEDAYNILIAHRPDYIDAYAGYPFDLVLSGHTHGGQVRIPLLLNGLFAPDQGWYPRYAGGRYQVEDTTLIVSRGVSYYPKLPRIFNPPEVVVIDLSR